MRGGEADKLRAAIVVIQDGASASAAQLGGGIVTVLPATSSLRRLYPFPALLTASAACPLPDSKAQKPPVRSVAVQRPDPRTGSVPPDIMAELHGDLRIHLAM